MRQEGVGPENARSRARIHAALGVPVLREDEAALAAEPPGLHGLADGLVRASGRRVRLVLVAASSASACAMLMRLAMLAVPGVHRVVAGRHLLLERDGEFAASSAVPARIGARMGRPRRADGHDRAGADPETPSQCASP